MVNDLGQRSQPHVGADHASRSASRGRTSPIACVTVERVHAEPAGQQITSTPVAKGHQRGRKPVDGDHAVLRTSAHRTLPRPGRKPGLMPLMPQRPHLSHEFSDHNGRKARDPPFADDRCGRHVPHHAAMIADPRSTSHRQPCTSSLVPEDSLVPGRPTLQGHYVQDLATDPILSGRTTTSQSSCCRCGGNRGRRALLGGVQHA